MDDPQVDDYVRWRNIKGWVYFKDPKHYLTIEIGVKPKPNCAYTRQGKHKYIHTLVLCFPWDWNEIEYIHSRKNKYGKTLEDMEIYTREF